VHRSPLGFEAAQAIDGLGGGVPSVPQASRHQECERCNQAGAEDDREGDSHSIAIGIALDRIGGTRQARHVLSGPVA
jgi:hypothetical protein